MKNWGQLFAIQSVLIYISWILLTIVSDVDLLASNEISKNISSLGKSKKRLTDNEVKSEIEKWQNERKAKTYEYIRYNFEPFHPSLQSPQKQSWGKSLIDKFRRRTSGLINAAAAVANPPYQYHGLIEDEDSSEDFEIDSETADSILNMLGTKRGGHGGGGYGHGGGHGGGYGKGVNKSAVGLLGFLSLLSLIQNALTTTAAAAPPRRGKRSHEDLPSIKELIAPMLISLESEAKLPDFPSPCILQEICVTNQKVVEDFGELGQSSLKLIEKGILKILKEKRPDVERYILVYAAKTGRNGKSCNNRFGHLCKQK